MHPFLVGGIELAVPNTGSSGHALQRTGPDHRAVAHAVLVLQRTFEDVGDNLHVPMAVHAESLSGLHTIVIDDSQGAKAHVSWIVVVPKGKCVVGIEPAVVEVTALGSFACADHSGL